MRYYLPAEWHKQIAVQLTWPHINTDWAPYLDEIVKMEVEMAREISKREHLFIATPEPENVSDLLKKELSESQFANVAIYEIPSNDTWARDHSAITLLPSDEQNEIALLDFKFNGWGDKFAADKDTQITRNLYAQNAFAELYSKGNTTVKLEGNNDFILEGGAIESDGKGTVFTTSFCLLAPHRNQPLSQEGVEKELKERLHAERILWIDYGKLVGDDTDGHIDTIVRPAPNDTLLYIKCEDENDEQYEDFKALEEQLKTFRTLEGNPYRLLPLPMPKAMYDDGEKVSLEPSEDAERLPATYANFLIVNGAVLVPTYGQADLDSQALSVIKEAFPDREIIGIDAQTAVRQHGSLHCLTMQFPKPHQTSPAERLLL